ncbi:sortase [Kitasatospora herbaricolor]|uniref:sortase n=1 Tax=Kitasatospora herbaricolor TaxID=68217 RepID=UPI0019A11223|nr:sortase [Kitasatospora herbaricolor]MDQ0309763.1 sortase A [Kitasatospora herbaricolor]GGU99760.1 sortase [Kitasatospora herbaricolor]
MSAPTIDPASVTVPAPAGPGAAAPAARLSKASAPAPAAAPAAGRSTARRRFLQAAWAASLAAALLTGFVGYLFTLSHLQERHSQSTSYKTFRDQLAKAVAPTGAAADGAPVALIDIPAIGLHRAVVVEGTTGRDLMRGPGHRRDTALPGQQGVSVLFGRGASFGAPFARLSELRVGDKITATTGQGRFTYTVNVYGDADQPITDPARNRLVLVTGDSGWIPSGTVLIGARLDDEARPNPGGRPATIAHDKALAADKGALAALQLWTLGLLGAVLAATAAARWWRRSAAYLSLAPVLGALLWSVYENAAALLPNLY